MVVYEFCKLNLDELNYPINEKELFVVIHALKFWRCYLLGIKFKIKIHLKSLKYLST